MPEGEKSHNMTYNMSTQLLLAYHSSGNPELAGLKLPSFLCLFKLVWTCKKKFEPVKTCSGSSYAQLFPNWYTYKPHCINFNRVLLGSCIFQWFGFHLCTFAKNSHNRPVNLHPLFLFWKHWSVYDPVKIGSNHCYSKREEARLPFLFLNIYDHAFCTFLFQIHILDLIVLKFQTLKNIKSTW